MEERRYCCPHCDGRDNSFDSRIIALEFMEAYRQEGRKLYYICTLHPNMRAKLVVQ